MSIGRALRCRRRLQQYIVEFDIGKCEALTRHDWVVLEKLHSFLGSYYEATMYAQGNEDHLGGWLSTLDFIHSRTSQAVREFQDLREQNPSCPEYSWLETAAKSALGKCDHYYDLAQGGAAYYAAEVLQPTRKWGWLHQQWNADPRKERLLDTAKKSVQKLWEDGYKDRIDASRPTISLECRPRARQPDIQFGHLSEHKKIATAKQKTDDAYQWYVDCDPETESLAENALHYWNARILSQPDLARFGLDMVSVPISSAECERIFSSAKLLITSSRNRLRPDIIEASECLRNWLKKPNSKTEMGSQDRQHLQIKEKADSIYSDDDGESEEEESGMSGSDMESDDDS